MAVLDIVFYPDERLKTPCKPVAEVNDEIRKLVDDMIDTMYDAPGVGLAAPQIGQLLRITVMDCSDPEADEEPNLKILINPEIIKKEGSIVWEEGCLSIPGVYEKVKRANKVTVRALDRDGNSYDMEGEGLLAVCIQHELDHLNGVLFLDHLSRLKRRIAERTYKKTLPAHLESLKEKKKKREESEEAAASIQESPSLTKENTTQE